MLLSSSLVGLVWRGQVPHLIQLVSLLSSYIFAFFHFSCYAEEDMVVDELGTKDMEMSSEDAGQIGEVSEGGNSKVVTEDEEEEEQVPWSGKRKRPVDNKVITPPPDNHREPVGKCL